MYTVNNKNNNNNNNNNNGDRGSTVVKVLCYKSEGYLFDPSWCGWKCSMI